MEKTVLVTGGSKGIGFSCVEKFLSMGYKVVATYNSSIGKLESISSDKLFTLRFNQADAASRTELLKYLNDNNIVPSVLVNNAGITKDQLLIFQNNDDIDAVLSTNVSGMIKLTRDIAKLMMRKKIQGSIVNLSSVVGFSGNVGQAVYATSKAAIVGFTKSMSKELSSAKIRVNCVAPGFIETDMTDAIPEELKKKALENIPLKRLGNVSDVANAIYFLSSDEASYITGEVLHVNGGLY